MPTVSADDVRAAAVAAHEAGLCVIPPHEDGSKHPIVNWTRYQQARPSFAQLDRWYRRARTGLGVVCGPVSGNLIMLEAEDDEVAQRLRSAARMMSLGEVVDRLDRGYLERTPGGGVHWLLRCAQVGRNQKLARRLKRPEEMRDPHDKVKVLVETREAGGYSVLAPSHGAVHPSGRPYVLLAGSFESIPAVTPEEWASLCSVARALDEMPTPLRPPRREHTTPYDGESIVEEFNARATWPEILERHGWTHWRTIGANQHWCRPGKRNSTSATVNGDGDGVLYVFSSSTMFEPERAYSKFAAYAILNHDGDFSAAARTIRAWKRRIA